MYQCVKLLTSERPEILKQIQNIADANTNAPRLVAEITSFKDAQCVIDGTSVFNRFARYGAESLQFSYTSTGRIPPILEE
jgi:hypothetical protein